MNWALSCGRGQVISFAQSWRNFYRTQRFEAEQKAAQHSAAMRRQQETLNQLRNQPAQTEEVAQALGLLGDAVPSVERSASRRSSMSLFRRSTLLSNQRKKSVHSSTENRFPGIRYSLIEALKSDLEEEDQESMALPGLPSTLVGLKKTEERRDWDKYLDDDINVTGGDFPWVESRWFQSLVGGIIFFNAIIIGLETDVKTPAWWWIEQLLLVFFCFELTVRLLRHKLLFFRDPDDWMWNCLDFFIVTSGVVDQWCVPLSKRIGFGDSNRGGKGGEKMGVLVMLMRMLRLLRIVRLFRLLRIVRPLYELAQGVLEAVQGMFWVLVLMVMVLYAIAILCTRLIGHGAIMPSAEVLAKDAELYEIQQLFQTVPDSMFALFGSMSSWSLLYMSPMFEDSPFLKPVFVLFYVYSAWALLAVMTGVVSENMISIREQMTREDDEKENIKKRMIQDLLRDLFHQADEDGSGQVSREEFDTMLRSPEFVKKVTKQSHIRVQDLLDLFEWIDRDASGTITIDEFMQGIKWLNEPLGAKSLVKLQESLAGDLRTLEKDIMSDLDHIFVELGKVVAQPLRKVHAITEQMQNLDLGFRDLRSGIEDRSIDRSSEEALAAMDARLTAKLNELLHTLDDLEGKERGNYGSIASSSQSDQRQLATSSQVTPGIAAEQGTRKSVSFGQSR